MGETPLRHRSAGPADLELLAAMNAGLIRDEGYAGGLGEAALKSRMAGWLESGAWRVDLFEAAGEVVGYAAFRRERHDHYGEVLSVRQFYIRPEHRRRGLGRRALLRLLRRRGRPGMPVHLEVLEGNAAGRAFWQALGFRPYATVMERRVPEG